MKTIIVGGVAGGATVAARLRRMDEHAEIILIERGEYVSYANCGLPYYIGDTITDRNKLFVQTVQGFKSRFNIDIRNLSLVESIQVADKTVHIRNLSSGEVYVENYDKLVLSPGSEPMRPPIPGLDSKGIFTLRNVPDTDKIKNYINQNPVKSAVVVGGGFIGLEMAENLHHLGIQVTVIEMGNQVMAPLDYSMAAIVHQHLRTKNVRLILSEGVVGFEPQDEQLQVKLKSGGTLTTDLVIWSIGVRPETQLAKDAGIPLGKLGGIAVNGYMQTSYPDIYALGDATEIHNPVTNQSALIPLAGPANKQARIVADHISTGISLPYKGTIGTAVVKIFDITVATAGASAKLLQRESIPYSASYTHSASHAGYYPGSTLMSIKSIFDPETGRLLGAQIVGMDGVDKRIDLFAQVIRNQQTVYDLGEIEHAYAPPYSSAKDPVNIAGFAAQNILAKRVFPIHWRAIADLDLTQNVLVDVRTVVEFELGSIKGAINIPVDDLRGRLADLDKSKNIALFCAVGLRGYLASRILLQNGFERVQNLSGGYKTYSVAIAPITPIAPDKKQENKTANTSATKVPDTVDLTVDACGLQCPGPIIQLKKAYDTLSTGQKLNIRASDPSFTKDVASWCHITGAKLIEVGGEKGLFSATVEKQNRIENATVEVNDRNTIVIFSDDLDKALAAFVIANGAAAMGKKVSLFFTFWGLNIIKKKQKPRVQKDFFGTMFSWMMPSNSLQLKLSKMQMLGMGSWMMRLIMKKKGISTLEELMQQAIENKVEMIACTMSMDVMGVKKEELLDQVDLAGVATYLERTATAQLNLFV